MSTRWVKRVLGVAVTTVVVAGAWWLLAPTQIGGGTGYVVVKGTSMEPLLHDGDFVITRARSSYAVDDVVLFESDTLGGATVLHRIVDADGGRFTTKGDNRTSNDPDHFTEEAVVGRLWTSLPGVGSALAWLGQPLQLAIFIFVLVFLVLAGGREVSRRGRPLPDEVYEPLPTASGATVGRARPIAASVLPAAGVAAVAFACVAALAWTRPITHDVVVADAYTHRGTFSYGADVRPSAVYPDGTITTGQVVFGEVVKRINVAFDYRFASTERSSVRGGIALDAVVSDGEGWARSLLIAPPQPFEGEKAHVEGTLDLRRLNSAVTRMRQLTGTGEATFHVAIAPRVQVAGYSGTTLVDTTFEPQLPFTWDGLALRLDDTGEAGPGLAPELSGDSSRQVDTTVGIGSVTLTTGEARTFAVVGVVVSLLLVAASALLLARRGGYGAAAVLHTRYGERIVDGSVVVPEGRWISDVSDAASIGVIAEHYDRVILHGVDAGGDVYIVDDGVAVYRFREREARAPSTRVSPAQGT